MSNPTLVELVNEWVADRMTDSFVIGRKEREVVRTRVRIELDKLIAAGLITEGDIEQDYLEVRDAA